MSDAARNLFLNRARTSAPEPNGRKTFIPDDEVECLEYHVPDEIDQTSYGQSFIIEYSDSDGRKSCRRITVSAVQKGRDGAMLLRALCHERRALRSFKVDQITSCIDFNGEVHEPRQFLNRVLSLAPDESPSRLDRAKLRRMKAAVGPHAILLSSLSRCDGYFHPEELTVAAAYCEHLCDPLRPTLEECDALIDSLSYLRPSEAQVLESLDALIREPADVQIRFFRAAKSLISADGVIKSEELAYLDTLSRELFGASY